LVRRRREEQRTKNKETPRPFVLCSLFSVLELIDIPGFAMLPCRQNLLLQRMRRSGHETA
jgi:hypothetical protein